MTHRCPPKKLALRFMRKHEPNHPLADLRLESCIVYIDHQPSMIDPKSSFQPHMLLQTRTPFSLLCHWKRLDLALYCITV